MCLSRSFLREGEDGWGADGKRKIAIRDRTRREGDGNFYSGGNSLNGNTLQAMIYGPGDGGHGRVRMDGGVDRSCFLSDSSDSPFRGGSTFPFSP